MQVLAAFVRTKALAASGQKSDVRQLRLHLSEEFSDAREHHEDEKEERDERERENWRNYSPEGTYEYFIGTLNKDYVPKYLIEVQAALSAIGKQNSGTYPLDLSKTVLEGITLEGNYENVSFYETHFKDCVFGNQSGEKTTSFRGDSFVRATFEKVEFIDSDIRKAHLDNSVLISATFNDSDFREATLTKARFSGGTKICKCKFNGTTWNESRIGDLIVWTERSTNSQITALKALRSAYFTDQSEVSDTDMTGAKFEGVKLVNTLFKRTLFKKGRYKGMSFERAILSGVIFENVDLSDSDFTEAQIGYEATFYNSSEHCKRREDYQENYSDEVVFAKAGIKRADLEKGKAIIIKATFS